MGIEPVQSLPDEEKVPSLLTTIPKGLKVDLRANQRLVVFMGIERLVLLRHVRETAHHPLANEDHGLLLSAEPIELSRAHERKHDMRRKKKKM